MHVINSKTSNFSERILEQFGGRFLAFWTFFPRFLPLNSCKDFQNHPKFPPHARLGNKNNKSKNEVFRKLEAFKHFFLVTLGIFQVSRDF